MSTLPNLHKPDPVAAALGCSPGWLKERCRRGEFPFVRVGKHYRFTDAQVAEIIQLLEQRPDQQSQRPRATAARRSAISQQPAGQVVTQLRARPPRRVRG